MSEIKQGDFVKINGQETVAEVLSVKGNDLQLGVGMLKVSVKKNKVTLAPPPIKDDRPSLNDSYKMASSGIDTKEKLMHFKFELDVRGKMKEDIMIELPVWVDEAVLLGVKEAKVVHGRGNGILKDTVRTLLRKYKEVASVGDEGQGKGGDYVTLVKFRD